MTKFLRSHLNAVHKFSLTLWNQVEKTGELHSITLKSINFGRI